jgi:hypothetical protein
LSKGGRIEEMMHEKEEGGDWELNSEDVDGFDMNMMMSHPEDPHHTFIKELNTSFLGK